LQFLAQLSLFLQVQFLSKIEFSNNIR